MLMTLVAGAAVVIATTPTWGTGGTVTFDDAVLSAAPTYTIGLQPAHGPGTLPGERHTDDSHHHDRWCA